MENRLIFGECIAAMKELPSESVDMVLTDPPYGISQNVVIHRNSNPGKFKGDDINYNFGKWDEFPDEKTFWRFTRQWTDECVRALKPGGVIASYFDRDRINFLTFYLKRKHGFKGIHYLADVDTAQVAMTMADLKSNPVPQCRKVKWSNGWEILFLMIKPGGESRKYNYKLGQHADYWYRPIVGGNERKGLEHPCCKPLSVGTDLVSWWTNAGDIILDPFMGSGTFPYAAKILNRGYIGIEADEKHFKTAEKRLQSATLFEQPKEKIKQEGMFENA